MREIRWNCRERGQCFRETLCPRLGVFDDCFPRKIGMSDVDGLVEINGHFLFLEWKTPGGALARGQQILFERLTALSPKVKVVVVSGTVPNMEARSIQVFERGKSGLLLPATLPDIQQRIAAWAERVQRAPRVAA